MIRRRLGFRKWRREELGSWWPGPGKAPGKLALGVVPALLLCLQGAPGVAARPPEASSPAVARTQCEETDAEIIVDLEVLEDSLRHTRAVGPMTKLKIKRDVDKLLAKAKDYHAGRGKLTLEQLKEQFDLLYMKIVVMLQVDDAALHHQLCNSWDRIWALLQDPEAMQSLSVSNGESDYAYL